MTSQRYTVSKGTRAIFATVLAGALALGLGMGAVAAQPFELPDGFVAAQEPELSESGEWRPVLTVRPVEGPFSDLSAIHLREVTSAVDDPDDWLKARLSGDGASSSEAEQLFTSPDSPFGDPAFDALRKAIPELFKALQTFAEFPLQFCDGPETGYNASGKFRELYCVYNLGPIRQYLVLRLQRAAGRWFYTEIRTMNERRLRHLLAIANSFHVSR